jgi:hypothetical protein
LTARPDAGTGGGATGGLRCGRGRERRCVSGCARSDSRERVFR